MATGRDIQLTRQIGEYLAAAELGRRGWVATTFTGSLPGFDILAVNTDGQNRERVYHAPQRQRSAFGFRTRSASLTLWGGRARPASSAPVTELGR